MVKISKPKEKILIELVRQNKMLYDPNDFDSKNTVLKDRRWEEISQAVGISVVDCRTRWKSLRDQYRKKRKAELIGMGHEMANWKYAVPLEFMRDIVTQTQKDRPESTTGSDDAAQSHDYNSTEEIDQNTVQVLVDDEDSEYDSTNEDLLRKSNVQAQKRKSLELTKHMAKRESQRSNLKESTLKTCEGKTPIQKFFESMADTVNRLPAPLQAEIRLKVCQVVTEVEMKYYAQDSSQQCDDRSMQETPSRIRVRNFVSSEDSD